jgi:hypothetical protein
VTRELDIADVQEVSTISELVPWPPNNGDTWTNGASWTWIFTGVKVDGRWKSFSKEGNRVDWTEMPQPPLRCIVRRAPGGGSTGEGEAK